MIWSCIMRKCDIPWEKGGGKTFCGNSLGFWTFYPWKHNPDPMAKSHLNFNELGKVNIQFSQTNKMFPCVWITKGCTHLSVNTAIWAFGEVLLQRERFLVFRFCAPMADCECESCSIGWNPLRTGHRGLAVPVTSNSISWCSPEVSASPRVMCTWISWGSWENRL